MTTLRNSINELRIRTLIAVAVPIAHASWIIPGALCAPGSMQNPASGGRLVLREGWQVQTSTGQADGAVISKAGFAATGWYPTAVPATVSGVLAYAGVYPDPFFGTNLRDWPGMRRGLGGPGTPATPGAPGAPSTPSSNPFSVGWWFRTEFDLPAEMAGRAITLDFEGINYRADIWLNGERIAANDQVLGAMRRFAFDVSKTARPGQKNALALLIQGQGPQDLGHPW